MGEPFIPLVTVVGFHHARYALFHLASLYPLFVFDFGGEQS